MADEPAPESDAQYSGPTAVIGLVFIGAVVSYVVFYIQFLVIDYGIGGECAETTGHAVWVYFLCRIIGNIFFFCTMPSQALVEAAKTDAKKDGELQNNKEFTSLLHLGLLIWGGIVVIHNEPCAAFKRTGLYEMAYILWIIDCIIQIPVILMTFSKNPDPNNNEEPLANTDGQGQNEDHDVEVGLELSGSGEVNTNNDTNTMVVMTEAQVIMAKAEVVVLDSNSISNTDNEVPYTDAEDSLIIAMISVRGIYDGLWVAIANALGRDTNSPFVRYYSKIRPTLTNAEDMEKEKPIQKQKEKEKEKGTTTSGATARAALPPPAPGVGGTHLSAAEAEAQANEAAAVAAAFSDNQRGERSALPPPAQGVGGTHTSNNNNTTRKWA